MEEEMKFIDSESYQQGPNKENLSFREICMQHLKRIGLLASKEMRGGYWQEKTRSVGGSIVTDNYYVPDSREEYSNAVDYLADVLYPHFDEEMKKLEEKSETDREEIYKTEVEESKEEPNKSRQVYRNKKVEIKRKLFRALCSFLYRKKYLEIGSL